MDDVRTLCAQQIDVARFAVIRGDQPVAAETFRAAIALARREPGLERELVTALVHLGKLEQELGRLGEAELLLREAIDVTERLFGAEHPSLCVLLNELSRLHIRQSDHARADAVLERLLHITRMKGDDQPGVATALAGLAMVKRALGDEAGAEQRYREALRIRERVLAPNHMAIVVTQEQLAETCDARGNLTEALTLLQRALPTREAAVGSDHATVQSLRSRIAVLEQRLSAPSAAASETPPEEPLSGPNDLVFIYQPERPAPRRAPPRRERMATPRYSAALAASLIASPLQAATPVPPAPSTQPTAPAAPRASARPGSSAPAPTRGSIPTPVADMAIPAAPHGSVQPWAKPKTAGSPAARRDIGRSAVAPAKAAVVRVARSDSRSPIAPRRTASDAPAPRKRRNLYASVGAVMIALAIAGLTLRWSAGLEGDAAVGAARPEPRPAPDVTIPTTPSAATPHLATSSATAALGATTAVAVVRTDSSRAVSASPAPTVPTAQSATRAPDTVAAEAVPGDLALPNDIAAVSVAAIATTNVDSILGASTKAARESSTDRIVATGGLVPSSTGDEATARPAVLIGPAPLPHFPDALRSQRTEGEVIVRFRVDERGLVDGSSMKVVKSDHPLFTAAVRRELPRFRFQPARSPAPESKPRADWVDFRVEFTTRN